tara:strand:- start:1379 stop:1747 length:369 start_codon:yes stop_codon:yes gene_type:complete
MKFDIDKFNKWLEILNYREKESLNKANLKKEEVWTEEVIIPDIIFQKLTPEEKKTWHLCKVEDIYSANDVIEIFGVKPNELNKCFSKKFYKLTKDELEEWEKIGKKINTKLPINDILILYTQ